MLNGTNKTEQMYETLSGMSGEKVLKLLTDWHGMDLLDDDFFEYLQNEGIIPENKKITEVLDNE